MNCPLPLFRGRIHLRKVLGMSIDFLVMENVSKNYAGVRALDAIDFSIVQGEIHCLAGTNGSGKSTLIKILSGVEQPEPGASITVEGRSCGTFSAIDSIERGIEVIYQDLSLFPNLSVAENIAASAMVAGKKKIFSMKSYDPIAKKAMARIGVDIPLGSLVGRLSISEQQLVAICRALTAKIKLLVMDEPTTALTRKEIDRLLAVVTELKAEGISTLFVSHKLQEVMKVADRVTVLRDGVKIGCFPAEELDSEKIEFYMTGTNFRYSAKAGEPPRAKPLLEVAGYSKKGNFSDITFSVFPGEILGITGLLGSGRTELALALFGMNAPESGTLTMDGKSVRLRSVRDAIRLGIAYVPENRLVQGLILQQSVAKNMVATIVDRFSRRGGLLDHKAEEKAIVEMVEEFKIKIPSLTSPVSTLSGGNQQKVVLAKWVAIKPRVLILDGPTVGIDIAAKGAIHEFIKDLAGKGLGVIVISDEVSEVYNLAHRVIVMNRGALRREFVTSSCGESEIVEFMETIA